MVLKKGDTAPGIDYAGVAASKMANDQRAYIDKNGGKIVIPGNYEIPNVSYRTYVQGSGWQNWKINGELSGTVGAAKRMEAIEVKLTNCEYTGGIKYTTHMQSYGWTMGWSENGKTSGAIGKEKRMEAIRIELTGELANHYDVYYRVHTQTFGWLAWAKNGENAGTSGYAKGIESVQIILIPKSGYKPANSYKGVTSDRTEAYLSK